MISLQPSTRTRLTLASGGLADFQCLIVRLHCRHHSAIHHARVFAPHCCCETGVTSKVGISIPLFTGPKPLDSRRGCDCVSLQASSNAAKKFRRPFQLWRTSQQSPTAVRRGPRPMSSTHYLRTPASSLQNTFQLPRSLLSRQSYRKSSRIVLTASFTQMSVDPGEL